MWDLSTLTKDGTHASYSGSTGVTSGTPGSLPKVLIFNFCFFLPILTVQQCGILVLRPGMESVRAPCSGSMEP